ncbi:MAG: MBL fold metallo-hydrolase, partial [Candidatus Promineifilaceae bacterium]
LARISIAAMISGMDIKTLDLNFLSLPDTIASYLLQGPHGNVLVETGPASTLPTLRQQLSAHGLQLADIDAALLTHIHLDHAGAAGWLAREGVQLYVHEVGAPHLIDPSRLLTSAGRIYGERMDELWGETVAAPPERVTAVGPDEIIDVAGFSFTALDTPGHAWHHHSYRLGDIAFSGDAAGIRLPGTGLVDLPAPPPEFKLEIWQHTIERLLDEHLAAIYPTHFGRTEDVTGQLTTLRSLMEESAEFVRLRLVAGEERDTIVAAYIAWNHQRMRAQGLSDLAIRQYNAANPLYMSVDGILRYWNKKLDR